MGQVLLRLTNWVNGLFLSHTNLSSQGKDNPAGVIQKIRGARSPAGAGVFHRRRKKATYTSLKIRVTSDPGRTKKRIASLSDQEVVSVFNWTEIGQSVLKLLQTHTIPCSTIFPLGMDAAEYRVGVHDMFANLSIAKKLYAGFGVIVLIICVLVFAARQGFEKVDDAVQWNIHTYSVLDASNDLLTSLINSETGMRGFALTGRDAFLEPLTAGRESFDQSWNEAKQLTSDNPVQQQRLDSLKALQRQWLAEDVEPTLALRRAINAGQQSMDAMVQRISEGRDKAKMDAMRKTLADLSADEEKLMTQRRETMASSEQGALWTLNIGGAIAALCATFIAMGLAGSIKRRLQQAVDLSRAIAAGRLNNAIPHAGGDEVGALLGAFAAMQTRLREMITQIKQEAQALVRSGDEISNTSQQLASAAQEQSHSASMMAATVEELTVSINHVADNANEAHQISSDSGRQSDDGGAVIQQTLDSMKQIAGTVQNSAAQISTLGQHAEQISSIVSVISEIADQTNLLALNAAIEAARAGEQGRGFAVVADEVRLLAQRTGKSTQEIADMIKKIQTGTHEAVQGMSVGVQQVDQGLELAGSANQAIVQIRDGSDRVISVVDQISVALRQQTVASQDVARNVERIAQMAEINSHSIDTASANAQQIKRLAESLDRQVAQFEL